MSDKVNGSTNKLTGYTYDYVYKDNDKATKDAKNAKTAVEFTAAMKTIAKNPVVKGQTGKLTASDITWRKDEESELVFAGELLGFIGNPAVDEKEKVKLISSIDSSKAGDKYKLRTALYNLGEAVNGLKKDSMAKNNEVSDERSNWYRTELSKNTEGKKLLYKDTEYIYNMIMNNIEMP